MIDMHLPPAYIQIAQKPTPGAGQPLQLVPSQPPQPPSAPPAADQSQPQQPPPGDSQPERIEVTPLDVGRYGRDLHAARHWHHRLAVRRNQQQSRLEC